ncbi:MAG: hypothetical protein ACKO2N_02835 [Tabrizicola sp.]
MSKTKDLAQLADLAQLMLDHRLGTLKTSSDRLEQSRMQLLALNQSAEPFDLDPVTTIRVGLEYERWADQRRAELNLVIARQSAAWLEARGEAQMAFGRLQALRALAEKSKSGRR